MRYVGRILSVVKALLAPSLTCAAAVVAQAVAEPAPSLIGIAIAALVVAFLGEIAGRLERPRRVERAARRLLAYFANQVFTVPDNHGQSVPDLATVKAFRITVMKPNLFRRLRPFLRAEAGVEPYRPTTQIWFHKGDAIAGYAWEKPGSWAQLDLPSLQDCGGDRTKWRAAWDRGSVRDGIVRAIETGQSRYMEYVRSIACLGIKVDGTVLVISIDSVFSGVMKEPDAGGPSFFRTVDPKQLLAIANFLANDVDEQ